MAQALDDERILEEAASWFSRLRTTSIDAATIEEFFNWRATPENLAAYNRVEALWRKGQGLASDPDILRAANEALGNSAASSKSPRRRGLPPLLAATLTLIAAAALGAGWVLRTPAFDTGVGEQRSVRLADGSNLILDTDSRAVVQVSASERKVVLERGQALFAVAPDAKRPFIVTAGDTEIRALGTRFDVRRDGDLVRVTLIEGKVRVQDASVGGDWTLKPGEQLTTAPRAAPIRADTGSVTSWTTGRLIFRDQRLSSAVEEANRYSNRKIRLSAGGVAHVRVNGVFDTGDVDALAEAAAHLYDLDLQRAPNGDLVLQKRSE